MISLDDEDHSEVDERSIDCGFRGWCGVKVQDGSES